MSNKKLPPEFVEKCKSIKAKRPKTVIDHILKNGFITTEELKNTYGYNHPPRAARDVKECGIPLEVFRVEGSDGRKIAAYRFGDPSKARFSKLAGRTAFAKNLKAKLIELNGAKCAIYLEEFAEKNLQIDHRIPFEIAGDLKAMDDPSSYMLLCISANRAKSWCCEHCENWVEIKNEEICKGCYWAYPESYSHIAMEEIRRIDLIWEDLGVKEYEILLRQAVNEGETLPSYVKNILKRHIAKDIKRSEDDDS